MKKNILLIASLYSYHTIECVDASRSDMLQRPMSQAEKQLIHAFYADGLASAEKLKDLKKAVGARVAVEKRRLEPGAFYLYNRPGDELKKIGVFPFNHLKPTAAEVKDLAISPNGKRLLVCFDARTDVYNGRTGQKKYSLPATVGSPTINPDGTLMLARSFKRKQPLLKILLSGLWEPSQDEFQTETVIRELKRGKPLAVLNSTYYNPDKASAAFAHDNQTVFVSSSLNISRYSVATGAWIERFFGPSIEYSCQEIENSEFYFYGKIKISQDSTHLIALRTKSTLAFSERIVFYVFNLADGTFITVEPYGLRPFTLFRDGLCAVSFATTPDNQKIVVWPHDINQVAVFDITTGHQICLYEPADGEKIVDMQENGTLVCYKHEKKMLHH